MQLLDGRAVAEKIKSELRAKIIAEKRALGLAVILVGNNDASQSYIHKKKKACSDTGITDVLYQLPDDTTQRSLEKLIAILNQDPKVQGILLQLPLPAHLKTDALLEKINPKKDVDGFHPYNLGRLVQRRPLLRPCTPFGVITLLESTGETIAGKHAVVVGASNIVGRPMVLELLLAKCTVTVCHRFTNPLSTQVQAADILISAT